MYIRYTFSMHYLNERIEKLYKKYVFFSDAYLSALLLISYTQSWNMIFLIGSLNQSKCLVK